MKKEPWWSGMAKMRSFKIVTLLFAKAYNKYRNFKAVVKTAEEYPYANVHMTQLMLKDLDILYVEEDKVKCNEKQLKNVLEYILEDDD